MKNLIVVFVTVINDVGERLTYFKTINVKFMRFNTRYVLH